MGLGTPSGSRGLRLEVWFRALAVADELTYHELAPTDSMPDSRLHSGPCFRTLPYGLGVER